MKASTPTELIEHEKERRRREMRELKAATLDALVSDIESTFKAYKLKEWAIPALLERLHGHVAEYDGKRAKLHELSSSEITGTKDVRRMF